MQLKRLYDTSGPEPRLRGIQLLHAGPRQNFSARILERGVAEGWISMGEGKVVLRTIPPTAYRILRTPGYYCCHCQKALDDGPAGQAHIAAAHPGKASPDASNPAGYRKDNFYACVREGSAPTLSPPEQKSLLDRILRR